MLTRIVCTLNCWIKILSVCKALRVSLWMHFYEEKCLAMQWIFLGNESRWDSAPIPPLRHSLPLTSFARALSFEIMIIVLGSTLTLIATFFFFAKSKMCKRFFIEATCELKYNLLAVKEIAYDYLLVLYNKTGERK